MLFSFVALAFGRPAAMGALAARDRASADPEQSGGTLQAQWCVTREGFRELEHSWGDLLARSQSDCVYLTFDWAWTWWEHFGAAHELRVWVLSRNQRIVAIAPLMLSRREGLRELGFIAGKITDYKDFIVDAGEDRAEVLSALLQTIDHLPGWDLLAINGFRADSPNHAALQSSFAAYPAHRSVLQPRWVSPYVTVDSDWQAHWSSLARNFRRGVTQRMKRVTREGRELGFRLDVAAEEVDPLLDRLAAFHVAKWKNTRGQYSLFQDDRMLAFWKALARRVLRKGWLRLPALCIDREVAAVELGFEYGGRLYCVAAGYDASHARYAPGSLLDVEVLRDAFARRLHEVDFLTGDEEYKFRFGPELRQLCWVGFFARGLRGRLARLWFLALRPYLERLQDSPLGAVYSWYRGYRMRRG